MIVYAQAEKVAQGFVDKLNDIIFFPLISLAIGVALVVFLYGLFEFVAGAGNEEARAKGRRHLLWGIIGFVIMLSAFTILSIAANTFGVQEALQ